MHMVCQARYVIKRHQAPASHMNEVSLFTHALCVVLLSAPPDLILTWCPSNSWCPGGDWANSLYAVGDDWKPPNGKLAITKCVCVCVKVTYLWPPASWALVIPIPWGMMFALPLHLSTIVVLQVFLYIPCICDILSNSSLVLSCPTHLSSYLPTPHTWWHCKVCFISLPLLLPTLVSLPILS